MRSSTHLGSAITPAPHSRGATLGSPCTRPRAPREHRRLGNSPSRSPHATPDDDAPRGVPSRSTAPGSPWGRRRGYFRLGPARAFSPTPPRRTSQRLHRDLDARAGITCVHLQEPEIHHLTVVVPEHA